MKKLLGATIACTMGLVFAFSFTACDTDNGVNDAEVADKVISTVKVKYIDEAAETPSDYEVVGQTIVDKVVYPVTWSVSTTETGYNLSDYVTVGTMNETTKMVTISVNGYSSVINYTLTASITVGSETRTVSFERHTVVTFTVAEAIAEGNKLEKNAYYQGGTSEAVLVLVKGYVVDPGTYNSGRKSFDNVYIVDEYSADKDKNSDGALLVFRMALDSKYLTQEGDLTKGDLITVQGYIQNYNGNTVEVTYKEKVSATCVGLKKVERTDAEKVAAAKAAVKLSATSFFEATSVTLPSTNNEASLTWSVEGETSLVTIANGKLNIVSVPDTETTVTLKVTITSGSVTDYKTIDITLVKSGTNDGSEAHPFTVQEAIDRIKNLTSGAYYQVNGENAKVYVKGYVTDPGTVRATYISNMYIADTKGAAKTDSLWVYSVNPTVNVPDMNAIEVDGEVVVCGYLQKYNSNLEMTGYNSDFPSLEAYNAPEYTDAEKAQKALNAVKTSLTAVTAVPESGTVDLPASTVDGVTLHWSTEDTTYTVDNNKLTVTALPTEADATVTLKVYATCNGATTPEKTVTIKIKKENNNPGNTATLSFAGVTESNATAISDGDCTELILGYVGSDKGLVSASITKGYKGTGTGTGVDATDKCLKFGTGKATGALTLTFDKAVAKVEINCRGWGADDTITITDGAASNPKTLADAQKPGVTVVTKEFELKEASNVISIVTGNRAMIFEIVVYWA